MHARLGRTRPSTARLTRRVPVTILFALGIGLAGLATRAPWSAVAPDVLARWGFSPHDLTHGRWFTLITSVFLTRNPLMFWGILLFTLGAVGVLEWQVGPRRALTVYWQTELIGTLGTAVLLQAIVPASWAPLASSLARTHEVGMSAGGFGCLGAVVARLPRRRAAALWGVMTYLVVRLVFFTQLSGDTVHLMTFPLGCYLESRSGRGRGGVGGRAR